MLISGTDYKVCYIRVKQVFQKLRTHGIKVNEEK